MKWKKGVLPQLQSIKHPNKSSRFRKWKKEHNIIYALKILKPESEHAKIHPDDFEFTIRLNIPGKKAAILYDARLSPALVVWRIFREEVDKEIVSTIMNMAAS